MGHSQAGNRLPGTVPLGLHDPRFERDSCGVAFVASLRREASHRVVQLGLEALANLAHRGATGADPETGDGAGILIQLPDALLRRDIRGLPDAGAYGLGVVFLPSDPARRARVEELIEAACDDEGLRLLAWRDVPVDASVPGPVARAGMPVIRQCVVGAVGLEGKPLERRLYVLRRVIERRAAAIGMRRDTLHVASFSSRTAVYKGMLTAPQLVGFYPDLTDDLVESRLALVHARFSTNVLPRWDLAQPLRMCAHNGEINTLRGNANWMRARQSKFRSPLFGDDLSKLRPVLDEDGSDSAQFDNALELLVMGGRSIPHAMVMMIPEAWQGHPEMDPDRRAFYEFHSSLLEPWDGPAAIAFTDGSLIGATLDRNGLRPARWMETDDGLVVLASEAGVLPVSEDRIIRKRRLEPGRLLLVDTESGEVLDDDAVKSALARAHPYSEWISGETVRLDSLTRAEAPPEPDPTSLLLRQIAFGYTEEELRAVLAPMAERGEEPIGSMGNDVPLAALGSDAQPLVARFKQLFAQVTNPPIDPIREKAVMSLVTSLGAGGNLLEQGPAQARRLEMDHPVLDNSDLETLRHVTQRQFPVATIPILFHRDRGPGALDEGIERICHLASEHVAAGATVLVLSDRHVDANHVPIPSLLATAAVHHHLVREQTRTGVGLVVESGDIREVMHLALLIGYGAEAVNPYLALETVTELHRRGLIGGDLPRARRRYVDALCAGLRKTISKMGISTIQSYCGAQVFEAVGLDHGLIARHFPGTPSRIGGIGLKEIASEALERHAQAFPRRRTEAPTLRTGGAHRWRRDAEPHQWNPETIGLLQHAVRSGDESVFRRYVERVDAGEQGPATLRHLFELSSDREAVPLDEVEPVSSLVRRFVTGAMSLGSISPEMHETLAIAMNRIGGRSNTGEGGEDPRRYTTDENGDLRRSAIKQVASARFGVTAHYLVNAAELQIKIAQGAKPGEGGQLPGDKVDEYIAELRHSTPGVGLISPPPHHDIYSIEDLAQLIHDLRCVNPQARISVKLVAAVGVGTIAAGVVKAGADHVVIAGYDGGTGASPLSSVKHAGVPWELGIAEAQQVLTAQGLRDRVVLQVDGQMKTGRDVVVAAALGAEEAGFSTAPLIAAGCVMMRVCHLNTCPVGIATQDPQLRSRFEGKAEHIVRFMEFLAEDVRRHLAALGYRSLAEVVGRTEVLQTRDAAVLPRLARRLDIRPLLHRLPSSVGEHAQPADHTLDTLDQRIMSQLRPALETGEPVRVSAAVSNRDRSVGAYLSGEIARRFGADGLADDTITIELAGSAGMSLGAWLARGVSLRVVGEANDYVAKGLSGGRIALVQPPSAHRRADENVIAGNVCLYGATSGELLVNGLAGERFAVRNSGAVAVVEGVGDHGCEYMTGGTVVVLGRVGRNFAAGMSGGVAYVLDADRMLSELVNPAMVTLEELEQADHDLVRSLVGRHHAITGSDLAERLLARWERASERFVKVMPIELQRVLEARVRRLEIAG